MHNPVKTNVFVAQPLRLKPLFGLLSGHHFFFKVFFFRGLQTLGKYLQFFFFDACPPFRVAFVGLDVYGWLECLHHVVLLPEEVHAELVFEQEEKVHVDVQLLESAFIATSQTPHQVAIELQGFGVGVPVHRDKASVVIDFFLTFFGCLFLFCAGLIIGVQASLIKQDFAVSAEGNRL